MYNHKEIEKKWQEFWEKNKTFKVSNDFSKPKYYTLDMFPYPSWAWLHVWHPEWYTANDIVARYKNAKWFNVLHPMGWDAFWLPAENYAIKTWTHPRITTDKNISVFKKQIKELWFSYDWDREVDTTDPDYYKWTQWIFLKLFENGLAYEQDLPINYCPSCKTGLANEEVLKDFSCERCGEQVEKKKIRQWVLAITKYADRLLKDVDKLDWPESIKEMQRNWIGKSEGCEFEMKKSIPHPTSPLWGEEQEDIKISVYTTRIDTVFGMTYAVLAPDHKDVDKFIIPEQREACEEYIKKANSMSDQDRTADDKEKTWVFTWSYVINPFNGEKVPLWIGDYVLWNYWTWAVMAVPAHDERDFEFAKKYGLEIKQSIAPFFLDQKDKAREDKETVRRNNVIAILLDNKNDKVFVLDWGKWEWKSFVIWWVKDWETSEEAVLREIREETWYQNIKIIKKLWWEHHTNFYAKHKWINRYWVTSGFLVELEDDSYIEPSPEETKNHDWFWLDIDKVSDFLNLDNHEMLWNIYHDWEKAFTEYWVLVNSSEFNDLTSEKAKKKLTKYAEKNNFWTKKVNYKLRDWLFSRQRYWGEPIPLIHISNEDYDNLPKISDISEASEPDIAYVFDKRWTKKRCKNCDCDWNWCVKLVINWKAFSKVYDWLYGKIVCDYNLPLKLPEVENYEPAWDGNSPLVKVEDFVNVKLANNLSWKRETNTMPQWWGSCWYYLRYMDPKNSDELVNPEVEKYWGQVDSYVWGAEHAVLHLLYARFWHKFLFDIKVVSHDEPFYRLRNQGLIQSYVYENPKWKILHNDLVEEVKWEFFDKDTWDKLTRKIWKMSKSLWNVINPDDIVNEYWADSLRLYEMYMAEFKDSAPWDTKWIVWVRRFIERVERLFNSVEAKIAEDDNEAIKILNKTIKKVWEDIENYKFNTAIAQMMILSNYGRPKDEKMFSEWKEKFAVILSPFVPHLAEELWEELTSAHPSPTWEGVSSIFFARWPEYDEKLVVDDTIEIAVQVLGKVRGTIEIAKDESKDAVLEKARNCEDVKKWIEGKELVKEIYVPGRIVNFVVR